MKILIFIKRKEAIKSVLRLWRDTLPWRQCVGHVRESNRVPCSRTVRKNMFLPTISSCSNLARCQCERKLCRYALKMRRGIWMRRHALRHGGWDLNEPGGGVLPYITYTVMCRQTGSWFWSSWFRTGYPFQRRFLERGLKNCGSRVYLLLKIVADYEEAFILCISRTNKEISFLKNRAISIYKLSRTEYKKLAHF